MLPFVYFYNFDDVLQNASGSHSRSSKRERKKEKERLAENGHIPPPSTSSLLLCVCCAVLRSVAFLCVATVLPVIALRACDCVCVWGGVRVYVVDFFPVFGLACENKMAPRHLQCTKREEYEECNALSEWCYRAGLSTESEEVLQFAEMVIQVEPVAKTKLVYLVCYRLYIDCINYR